MKLRPGTTSIEVGKIAPCFQNMQHPVMNNFSLILQLILLGHLVLHSIWDKNHFVQKKDFQILNKDLWNKDLQ